MTLVTCNVGAVGPVEREVLCMKNFSHVRKNKLGNK